LKVGIHLLFEENRISIIWWYTYHINSLLET